MAEITAKQLADALGISASAVSLALNGRPGVSEKTRAEVVQLAAKYGYAVPRAGESTARTAKKNICFLIYVDSVVSIAEHSSFSTFVLQGVEEAARMLGYNTMIRYFKAGSPAESFGEVFLDVDALIMLGTDITERRLDEVCGLLTFAHNIPVVIVDNYLLSEKVDCIGNDNFTGAQKAVRHLIDRGCKKIGYLRSHQRISNFDDREAGVRSALQQAGLELNPIVDVGISSEQAVRDMNDWLGQMPDLPDAFFADNDVLAIAAIRALKNYHIAIPAQVSVIGFDDVPICEMSDPPLSTVRSFKERLGSTAVNLIHNRLFSGETVTTTQHSGLLKIQVSMEIEARQSVRGGGKTEHGMV